MAVFMEGPLGSREAKNGFSSCLGGAEAVEAIVRRRYGCLYSEVVGTGGENLSWRIGRR